LAPAQCVAGQALADGNWLVKINRPFSPDTATKILNLVREEDKRGERNNG
jgi:hypothetical protein